ncbi:MAG: hypothetical protein QOJ54_3044 [Aliidongia sp.]|jgi:uncharacterized LabA/DUF88 family protein|nr:hypothetical protein [Aliidongia sp.]
MVDEPLVRYIPRERIGLFIDGVHLLEAARALNVFIDYGKLLAHYQAGGQVVRAFYYNAILPGRDASPGRKLHEWLDYNGFTTAIKQAKEFIDDNGSRRVRNGLKIDMVEMAPYLDHVVLFSGLGDLRRPVETLQRKGVRVTVVSTIHSPTPMAAGELRRQADRFDDPFDLAPLFARAHRHIVEEVA